MQFIRTVNYDRRKRFQGSKRGLSASLLGIDFRIICSYQVCTYPWMIRSSGCGRRLKDLVPGNLDE